MILVDIRQFTAFCKKRAWLASFEIDLLEAVGLENWEEPNSPGDFMMEEIQGLIAAAQADESSRNPKRVYMRSTLYAFMWESAVRVGQAYRTQWREFDLEHLQYERRKSKSKSKRASNIPISMELAAELRMLRPLNAEPEHYVWYNRRGEDPTKWSRINDRVLADDMASANVPLIGPDGRRRTFHSFRHGRASQLVADGVHPKLAQQLLDHADIRTTMNIYSRVENGALVGIVADAFKNKAHNQKKDLTSGGGIGEDVPAKHKDERMQATTAQPHSVARPIGVPCVSQLRPAAGRATVPGHNGTAVGAPHARSEWTRVRIPLPPLLKDSQTGCVRDTPTRDLGGPGEHFSGNFTQPLTLHRTNLTDQGNPPAGGYPNAKGRIHDEPPSGRSVAPRPDDVRLPHANEMLEAAIAGSSPATAKATRNLAGAGPARDIESLSSADPHQDGPTESRPGRGSAHSQPSAEDADASPSPAKGGGLAISDHMLAQLIDNQSRLIALAELQLHERNRHV